MCASDKSFQGKSPALPMVFNVSQLRTVLCHVTSIYHVHTAMKFMQFSQRRDKPPSSRDVAVSCNILNAILAFCHITTLHGIRRRFKCQPQRQTRTRSLNPYPKAFPYGNAVGFYTSTSNKRAARPKLYTKSLTRDLKRMYRRFTLVRISINL